VGVESILRQGIKREQDYDWLGAAESYRKALGLVPTRDFSKLGEVQEKIGFAFYRAAMQAENTSEFRKRMRQAVANYEKAKGLYGMLHKQEKKPWILRCDAMTAWLGYWLLSDASQKKKLLDECWNLTKECLRAFEKAGKMLEYGKTYNQLSSTAFFDYTLTWDFHAREKIIREATEYGEQTIALFSDSGDSHELARAYVKTALYLTILGYCFTSDMNDKERRYKKALDYWQKATELSEETAFLELLSFCGESLDWSFDDILVQYDKALGYAKKAKDRLLIGTALDQLAFAANWKRTGIEDADKRREFLQKALQYAEDTKHQFSPISFVSPRTGAFWTGSPNAEYHAYLASWETDLGKRRNLLETAVVHGTHAIKQAENTGYPEIITRAHLGMLGLPLVALARIETNIEKKKKLLKRALDHRKKHMNLHNQLRRFQYWNLGFAWSSMAILEVELSDVETNLNKRKDLLAEAASHMEHGLQLLSKEVSYFVKKGDLGVLELFGFRQYAYGALLNRLHELTNNSEHQRRAIKALEEAAQSYRKLNMVSRIAECNWKAAASCDRLGEHLKAAEYFNMASARYTSAAEKIPQLKGFYKDHALYMRAWSEIERGKHLHAIQEYGSAKEHYEKAAALHQSLKQWSYLTPNYHAWAQVENAEDLSRKEQSEKALQAFAEAAKLFTKTKKALQTKLRGIETSDEKSMVTTLMKASDVRRGYCLGRAALEEAIILSRKGDHYSSSERYGSVVETFEKVAQELGSEQDRKEFSLIISLSKAWQKMMMAEAKMSSTMYSEAAELFKQAKEYALNQPTSLLALANSSFCKALEAGTEFETTRDTAFFSAAKEHMETSANYYLKAGFENASIWVNANQVLLDAYVYMSRAETKIVHEEKIRQYQLAEKYLERSARLYEEAGYIGKKGEVLKVLVKVKEKKKFALSLSEAVAPPAAASSTTILSVPGSTKEEAVGLDRFEHANIQASLAVPGFVKERETFETAKIGGSVSVPEKFVPGEKFQVKLDLANVGKGPGLLVRIEDIVPPKCEVLSVPSYCTLEGASLNMKGKRLDPLSVESVEVLVQVADIGAVSLSPRVVYVDELGSFRTIRVEEAKIQAVLEFESKAAQHVFNYLADAFVEDCVKRRLSAENSGWRSFPQIIKGAGVSKRSLYGAGGRLGHGLSELQRKGLVDLETLLGERGRGGHILRVRIRHAKELVKRYVKEKAPDLMI
jgi:tetratricopeptide (TPR) repeat protein